MKKQIEIDNNNVIDIAFNMIVAASAKINARAMSINIREARILDIMTKLYLRAASQLLDDQNRDFDKSRETLKELTKLLY